MRKASPINRAFLMLIVVVGWLGLALQLWISAARSAHSRGSWLQGVADALCYFTMLTNLLVTVVATRLAFGGGARSFLTAPSTLAAAAVYIVVVGIIYSWLLRTLWAPTGLHKVADLILHDVMPVLFVLWWLVYAAKSGLTWSQPLKWLLYPLAYFIFAVVFGAFSGRYLYPFADIGKLGVPVVLRNAAVLLLFFWGVGIGAVALARAFGGARARPL